MIFPSPEMQTSTCRPKYTSSFITLSEKKRFTNLQMWDLQKYFSPVCILLVKFFLTNVLNVFPKLVTLKFFFNHHVLAVFEISVLKAVRILHNLHSNTNTKVKKISVSLSPAPFRGHIFHMRDNPYDLCFLQMLTKTKTTTSCNHFRRLFKSI